MLVKSRKHAANKLSPQFVCTDTQLIFQQNKSKRDGSLALQCHFKL